jgi:hypothetical protein
VLLLINFNWGDLGEGKISGKAIAFLTGIPTGGMMG